MVLVIGKSVVYSLSKSNGELSVTKVADFPDKAAVSSAASASKEVLYYVTEANPTRVMRWDLSHNTVSEFATTPVPVKKLVFYRNKLYCAPVEGTSLICVDPLNMSIEELVTHHTVVDFEPADHGFVVEDETGMLFGFHFNYGVCRSPGVEGAELLGHCKRYGVAISPKLREPFGVNEKGSIVHPPSIPAGITERFVSTEDQVFLYKQGSQSIQTLDGSTSCSLPPELAAEGVVCFAPVQDQDNEDVCTLCFCEFDGDGDGDGITLDCGHRFHKECVLQWVSRWDEFKAKGNHITFTNAVCPGGCKHLVRHPLLGDLSESILSMFRNVTQQSKKILQGMPATKLDEDLLFYVCSKCSSPFYGGEKVCFRTQGGEPTKDPADLVCDNCQRDFSCPTHARDFVVYKCFYCCNPATERSFGNRYICDRCSARWTVTTEPDTIPCPGPEQCPLGGNNHPETAYAIGCLACLTSNELNYDKITPAPVKESAPSSPQ